MANREVQELMGLSEEDLISRIGPGPGRSQSEKVERILDPRQARNQAEAAKALPQATEKQATAGDALVTATKNPVRATRRLSSATWALVIMTALLALAAGGQAYLTVKAQRQAAWALWVMGENPGTISYPDWTPLKAFDTSKQCEQLRPFGRYESRCLPDTVDPRGPKGSK